jgi:integrase
MKATSEVSTRGLIENHLVPYFQARDLREIREADLLAFAKAKVDAGLSPKTAQNALSVLRRVYYLAQREGRIERNPAARMGELMRRIAGRHSHEVEEAEAWSREEVDWLLSLAREHEARFYPALLLLFSTGLRRGELLGLKWADMDFDRRGITIRRSITIRQVTTPKSGRSRVVAMTGALAETLFDLLAQRRQATLTQGWAAVPEWVSVRPAASGGGTSGTSAASGRGSAAAPRKRESGPSSCTRRATPGRPSRSERERACAGSRTNSDTRTRP